MLISRRDFFMAGSAASTLLLAGCGGGGSADGAPKATTKSNACATLTDTFQVHFSNAVSFANSDLPLVVSTDFQDKWFGCSNQVVTGVEGIMQELFVSVIQLVSASQSCSKGYIRTLRLHLAIPADIAGTMIEIDDVFYFGDPTNPGTHKVFGGEIILTDLDAPDGQNSSAYQIMGGSIQILGDITVPYLIYNLGLSNVVAKAANAGSGNNLAYASGGQVEMNGSLPVIYESLTTYTDHTPA